MLRKFFNGQRISEQANASRSPWSLSASSGALFRLARAPRGRRLPSVRRNAPEVCRNTRRARHVRRRLICDGA
jgi:hypothetical protein